MPDRMPDRMPADMSEYMPEDMPDRMPDRMPEDMSDRMPEDMPDRMHQICQIECQKICQIECQKICQNICQKICQIECHKKMPEDMPDRMPEDMSDRMPEDLPVRKSINVMVGITRSKVFFFKMFFESNHISENFRACPLRIARTPQQHSWFVSTAQLAVPWLFVGWSWKFMNMSTMQCLGQLEKRWEKVVDGTWWKHIENMTVGKCWVFRCV